MNQYIRNDVTTSARTPKRLQQRHHRSHQTAQPGKDPKAAPVPIRKYRHRRLVGTKCVHVCVYVFTCAWSQVVFSERRAQPGMWPRGVCFAGLFRGLFRRSVWGFVSPKSNIPALLKVDQVKKNKQTNKPIHCVTGTSILFSWWKRYAKLAVLSNLSGHQACLESAQPWWPWWNKWHHVRSWNWNDVHAGV